MKLLAVTSALVALASVCQAQVVGTVLDPAHRNPSKVLEARQAAPIVRTVTRVQTIRGTTTQTLLNSPTTRTITVTAPVTSFRTVTTRRTVTASTTVIRKRDEMPELAKRQRARTSTQFTTITTSLLTTVRVRPTVTTTRTNGRLVYATTTATDVTTLTNTVTVTSSRAPSSSSTSSSRSLSSSSRSSSRSSSSSSASPTPTGKYPFNSPEMDDVQVFRNNILQEHNDFRAKFGVPALTWDSALESFAQDWVNGCKYQHSSDAFSNPPWWGENIAAGWAPVAEYLDVFSSADPVEWWGPDEWKIYNYDNRPSRDDHATGHFQSMVWRSFQTLGCAVAYCPNGLGKLDGSSVTSDPALMWSCDFGFNDFPTNWTVEYNIPRNIVPIDTN